MQDRGLTGDVRAGVEAMLEEHRILLHDCLEDMGEEEARRSLVPSRTTLLGLVKHVTYVEKFYFDHSITGRSLEELGVASTPDRSFVLTRKDTIASVRAAYLIACAESRQIVAPLGFGEPATGRTEQSVWTVHLRALRDFIQHCGHADILREQILAARNRS